MSVRRHKTFQERRVIGRLRLLQRKMKLCLDERRDYRVWVELQREVMTLLPRVPNYVPIKKKGWWL